MYDIYFFWNRRRSKKKKSDGQRLGNWIVYSCNTRVVLDRLLDTAVTYKFTTTIRFVIAQVNLLGKLSYHSKTTKDLVL